MEPTAPSPAPPSAQPAQQALSPMFQMMVTKLCGDMRFVGLFNMIFGGLYCLTIFGAVIGIPVLISGMRLRESADSFMYYLQSKDVRMLENALERQGRFFFIQKVIMMIGLVFIVCYIIFIIIFGLSMLRMLTGMGGRYGA